MVDAMREWRIAEFDLWFMEEERREIKVGAMMQDDEWTDNYLYVSF